MNRGEAERAAVIMRAALAEAGYPQSRVELKRLRDGWVPNHPGWKVDPTPSEVRYRAAMLARRAVGAPVACFTCWTQFRFDDTTRRLLDCTHEGMSR